MNTLHGIKQAPTPPASCKEEKVGVAKIRIRQVQAHATAILGSFVAADKLLRSWASGAGCGCECEFEIVYLDGYQLSGSYPMWQKCTTRQSLGAYVRRVIEEMDLGRFRFGAPGHAPRREPQRFLEQYEVEDFAERDLR